MKCEAAVSLAKLRRGITERKSARKAAAGRINLAKARAVQAANRAEKAAHTISI